MTNKLPDGLNCLLTDPSRCSFDRGWLPDCSRDAEHDGDARRQYAITRNSVSARSIGGAYVEV